MGLYEKADPFCRAIRQQLGRLTPAEGKLLAAITLLVDTCVMPPHENTSVLLLLLLAPFYSVCVTLKISRKPTFCSSIKKKRQPDVRVSQKYDETYRGAISDGFIRYEEQSTKRQGASGGDIRTYQKDASNRPIRK